MDTIESIHLAPYSNPTVRKLVTNLKYKSATCLSDSIRALLLRYKNENTIPHHNSRITITSVPASDKRLRERGVDQAAIIADGLREYWYPNAIRETVLIRTKHTVPNAKLKDERARQGNIAGAFEILKPVSGTVILVDDVFTSGATMNECKRVLLEAGAENVILFTIAKG
ncbi:MAG: phosphoribosyltransferase family protein [Candidatus Uhrbacteria bacterium]